MQTDSVYGYLNSLWTLLFSPQGFAGVGVMFILCVLQFRVRSARWVCLGLLFYVSTYAAGELRQDAALEYLQIPFPLSIIRAHTREFTVLLVVCLLVPLIQSSRGWRRHLVSAGLVFYVILQAWMCVRLYANGDSAARSLLSLISYALLLATLVVGVGRSLQSFEDGYALCGSFAFAGFLFAISNVYHTVMNPASSYTGRFYGITPNPQYVGQACALFLIPTLFLAQSPQVRKWWRPFLWTSAGLLIVFLIWSGSRTGVLMALVGVAALYRSHVDRFVVAGIFVGAAVLIALPYFPDAAANIAHILNTENTRAGAWESLIDIYRQNPLFGAQYQGTGYAESYYLAALAYYGLVGFIPALLTTLCYAGSVLRIVRRRSDLGPHAGLADVATAGMLMVLVISVFESFLLGVWNTSEMFLFVQFAFIGYLRDEQDALAEAPDEYLMMADAGAEPAI